MTMRYVRDHYGVPARRGSRVRFEGREGTITSATHYIFVRFDDDPRRSWPLHPTWKVEYLPAVSS